MTHILPAEVELTLCHRSSIRPHSSWMQHFQGISVLIRIANLLSFPWACPWNKSEPVFLSIGFVLQPQACMMLPAARCPASHPADMQPLLPITRHTKRDGHRGAAVEVPQNWQWAITSWAQKYHMKPHRCVAAESTSPPAHTQLPAAAFLHGLLSPERSIPDASCLGLLAELAELPCSC